MRNLIGRFLLKGDKYFFAFVLITVACSILTVSFDLFGRRSFLVSLLALAFMIIVFFIYISGWFRRFFIVKLDYYDRSDSLLIKVSQDKKVIETGHQLARQSGTDIIVLKRGFGGKLSKTGKISIQDNLLNATVIFSLKAVVLEEINFQLVVDTLSFEKDNSSGLAHIDLAKVLKTVVDSLCQSANLYVEKAVVKLVDGEVNHADTYQSIYNALQAFFPGVLEPFKAMDLEGLMLEIKYPFKEKDGCSPGGG